MASEENLERAVERLIENSRATEQRLQNEIVQLNTQIYVLNHKIEMLELEQKSKFDITQMRMETQFKILRWTAGVTLFLTFLLFMELVLFRGR